MTAQSNEPVGAPAKAGASNLVTRFLTAGVGAPLILLLLYRGPEWGWCAFIGAATLVGAVELFGMTHPNDRPTRVVLVALTLGLEAVIYLRTSDPRALVTAFILVPFVSIFLVLIRLGDVPSAALRVMSGVFGPVYLGGALATLMMLRRDARTDGPGFIVLALMLSWLSDTGAYFAGRFLGKHKLYEAVSPKKTVEGAIGGLAGGVVGSLLASFFYLRSLPIVHGVVLALVAGGLGQAGDLGESLLKRSFGVKDSGGIVPGHGGILDRVDALLVTSTACWLYVIWFR